MDDQLIIAKYWERDEQAIVLSDAKYGAYCQHIAYNITYNSQDSEECKNDTWLAAWHAMPPEKPNYLKAFFAKITRNLALDRYRKSRAQKRGSHLMAEILNELSDSLPDPLGIAEALDYQLLVEVLNDFLEALPLLQRQVFILRYWHGYSIHEIAKRADWSEAKVSSMLFRLRNQLKARLETEEIGL